MVMSVPLGTSEVLKRDSRFADSLGPSSRRVEPAHR